MLTRSLESSLEKLGRPLKVEEFLHGPDRIIPAVVVEGDAMDQWRWFRQHVESLGCWPLLLSNDQQCQSLLEDLLEDCAPVAAILETSRGLDPITALQERYEEPDVDDEYDEDEGWPGEVAGSHSYLIRTRLPAAERKGFWARFLPSTPRHRLLLVPTARPWEIFAWLNYGDWNDSPTAELHVALHKQWHERWGAEPVRLAPDTLECQVRRGPATQREALELARIQTLYCSDIVYQGVGTVNNLGALLMSSTVWYFWWD